MTPLKNPSKEAIDVILKYAPNPSSAQLDRDVSLFIEAVYATDFMAPFDWIKEFPQGALSPDNHAPLHKLLRSGYLGQLLARLKALRATL